MLLLRLRLRCNGPLPLDCPGPAGPQGKAAFQRRKGLSHEGSENTMQRRCLKFIIVEKALPSPPRQWKRTAKAVPYLAAGSSSVRTSLHTPCTSFPTKPSVAWRSPAPEPGGSACWYWNRYGTQVNHPAQGLTRREPVGSPPRAGSRPLQHDVPAARPCLQPSARLSFCWHPLPIPIETPAKGRGGGAAERDSLADGYPCLP